MKVWCTAMNLISVRSLQNTLKSVEHFPYLQCTCVYAYTTQSRLKWFTNKIGQKKNNSEKNLFSKKLIDKKNLQSPDRVRTIVEQNIRPIQ